MTGQLPDVERTKQNVTDEYRTPTEEKRIDNNETVRLTDTDTPEMYRTSTGDEAHKMDD